MFALIADSAIRTDMGIPAMLSGKYYWLCKVCGFARFCIEPAVVSRPFLTPAANVIAYKNRPH